MAYPLKKSEVTGQLSVQPMFFPPLRVKVPSPIGFMRHTLRTDANEKRGWGKHVIGMFIGRVSH